MHQCNMIFGCSSISGMWKHFSTDFKDDGGGGLKKSQALAYPYKIQRDGMATGSVSAFLGPEIVAKYKYKPGNDPVKLDPPYRWF